MEVYSRYVCVPAIGAVGSWRWFAKRRNRTGLVEISMKQDLTKRVLRYELRPPHKKGSADCVEVWE